MAKIGLFGARMDYGGLGAQTHNLARAIKPDVILAVDSRAFIVERPDQDIGRYDNFNTAAVNHWPTNSDVVKFIQTGVTHIFCCETPYNLALYSHARMRGVKVFTQINPEFFDGFNNPYEPQPYRYLLPSTWYMKEIADKFGADKVEYLPPPFISQDFKVARDANIERSHHGGEKVRRFLHPLGKEASSDRSGYRSILEALGKSMASFELVVRSQYPLAERSSDPRVTYDVGNVLCSTNGELYKNFDAVIQPRRYGGLNMPMAEALLSALPVIMTDISPNSDVLPPQWLVPAHRHGELKTRIMLDVFNADSAHLAEKLDWLATVPDEELLALKLNALEIGVDTFSSDTLAKRYQELIV